MTVWIHPRRYEGLWPVAGDGAQQHLARLTGEAPPMEPPPAPVVDQQTGPSRWHPAQCLSSCLTIYYSCSRCCKLLQQLLFARFDWCFNKRQRQANVAVGKRM